MDIRLWPLLLDIDRDDEPGYGLCLGWSRITGRPSFLLYAGPWVIRLQAASTWRASQARQQEMADAFQAQIAGAVRAGIGQLNDLLAAAGRDEVARAGAGVGPLWRRDGADGGDS